MEEEQECCPHTADDEGARLRQRRRQINEWGRLISGPWSQVQIQMTQALSAALLLEILIRKNVANFVSVPDDKKLCNSDRKGTIFVISWYILWM
jgi:hypothetical protein